MHYQMERNYGCRVSDAWEFRGLKTAVIENELIRVVVLVDKGADIYQFVHKPSDVDFMWRSPWGVRDPRKFVPTSGAPNGLWLDQYEGGWQSVFPGGGYYSVYNGADLGIHAEANLAPWDCQVLEDTPEKASIKFWIRTARTPFYFEKTLTVRSGAPVLEIEQSLTNEGEEEVHASWGEHIALGPPFLSEDCVIDIAGGLLCNQETDSHPHNRLKGGAKGPWPMVEGKYGAMIDLSRIPPKSQRVHDMSYITQMPEGWYAVTNQRLGVGFGISYPVDLFKYLWFWQEMGGGFGYPWWGRTYNIGLEPFTSYGVGGLASMVKNGTALRLKAGETFHASLRAVAYLGAERVKRVTPEGMVER
ncbi:MAG: DUF4432 family protein [SAR202 cluster bacterium]|nr:DUF4432 family protein [SAR202 cluster bacterium]